MLSRHYYEGETSIQMYSGRSRSDAAAEIRVVEKAGVSRSRFPSIPTDENVAARIDFLSNFLVDHTIVNAPGGEAGIPLPLSSEQFAFHRSLVAAEQSSVAQT